MSRRDFIVHIYKSEIEFVKSHVRQRDNIETGGDLFGLWIDDRTLVVQLVSGPGKNCGRSVVSFFQDIKYLEKVGKYLTCKEGICNVGEWHSHHRLGLPSPSYGDQSTVWRNMPATGLTRFVVFIANIRGLTDDGKPKVNIGCFLFDEVSGAMITGKFECLGQDSPLRLKPLIKKVLEEGAESLQRRSTRKKSGHQERNLNEDEEQRERKKRAKIEQTEGKESKVKESREKDATVKNQSDTMLKDAGESSQDAKDEMTNTDMKDGQENRSVISDGSEKQDDQKAEEQTSAIVENAGESSQDASMTNAEMRLEEAEDNEGRTQDQIDESVAELSQDENTTNLEMKEEEAQKDVVIGEGNVGELGQNSASENEVKSVEVTDDKINKAEKEENNVNDSINKTQNEGQRGAEDQRVDNETRTDDSAKCLETKVKENVAATEGKKSSEADNEERKTEAVQQRKKNAKSDKHEKTKGADISAKETGSKRNDCEFKNQRDAGNVDKSCQGGIRKRKKNKVFPIEKLETEQNPSLEQEVRGGTSKDQENENKVAGNHQKKKGNSGKSNKNVNEDGNNNNKKDKKQVETTKGKNVEKPAESLDDSHIENDSSSSSSCSPCKKQGRRKSNRKPDPKPKKNKKGST